MHPVYAFQPGNTPLLVSVPHDGREIPHDVRRRMTPAGQDIPDTDWHVARLYDFAHALGASVLVARYSRYVVDLNRPADDEGLYPGQVATGLCPAKTFAGDDIYEAGHGVDTVEQVRRVESYWQPYHERIRASLAELRDRHGYALLWDAHSIAGEVPRLFDGQLPVLNIGTFDGQSCAKDLSDSLFQIASASGYQGVLNGRFKGGYITRHYGSPANNIHAVQLEISQRAYMDEGSRLYDEQRAARLQETLHDLLAACLQFVRQASRC